MHNSCGAKIHSITLIGTTDERKSKNFVICCQTVQHVCCLPSRKPKSSFEIVEQTGGFSALATHPRGPAAPDSVRKCSEALNRVVEYFKHRMSLAGGVVVLRQRDTVLVHITLLIPKFCQTDSVEFAIKRY